MACIFRLFDLRCPAARAAWGLMVVAIVQGCGGEPLEYEQPVTVPPFIIRSDVVPKLDLFQQYTRSTPISVNVPFHSHDLGEDLEALVFFDRYSGNERGDPKSIPINSGVFEERRSVVLEVTSPDTLGCHTMTLVLTHENNVSAASVQDVTRAASVTWWLLINESTGTGSEVNISDCPVDGGS